MEKRTLSLLSIFLPLSSIFWDPFYQSGNNEIKLGVPFDFFTYYTYHNLEAPVNHILFLKHFFTSFSFRADIYIVNIFATYFLLTLLVKFYNRLKSRSA
ncbi:hypothetical protein D3C74_252930 [compost metagenome]